MGKYSSNIRQRRINFSDLLHSTVAILVHNACFKIAKRVDFE